MKSDLIPVGSTGLAGHHYPSLDMYSVQLPRDEVVPFYRDNWQYISDTGLSSFLKSLKIPEPYFKRLTASTKTACLAEAAADLKTDIMLLTKETRVEYAAPALYRPEVYVDDPLEHLRLGEFSEADNVRIKQLDFINGTVFFILTQNDIVRDEYVPSVQLQVPLFYAKNFLISCGLYKVRCTNGLMDVVSQSEMKLSFVDDPASFALSDFVYNIMKTAKDRADRYMDLLERLKAEPTDLVAVRNFADAPSTKKMLPGAPLGALKKHAALLYSQSTVPLASPMFIRNWYDVMDTLTYYAARVPGENTEKRRKAEKSVFSYFADAFEFEAVN